MQYTVLLFAVSKEAVARQMIDSSEEVLRKTRQFVEQKSDAPDAVEPIMAAAEAICRGQLPADASQPYFDAFYAIISVLGERIELDSFQFGSIVYLEDVGIWPWTQQEVPPFPLPRTKEELPQFGFMSCEFMQNVVLPGIDELPPSTVGQRARNEFAEVVESVVDDGLDLICYCSVW